MHVSADRTMPAKHPPQPGTLAYLAECGRPVFIICLNCGRFTVPRFYEIAREAGWSAMASDIGKRLRCTSCKNRGAAFTLERPRGRTS
jgi:hypothetical protein